MNKKINIALSLLLTSTLIHASDPKLVDDLTLTNISFTMDDDGNLNPNIFLPLYYGSSNQFYSAIGYSSTNGQDVEVLDNFSDSKNAFISSSKSLILNYVTYKFSFLEYAVSVGASSRFSNVQNNDFGYIHDSDNILGQGTDYYVSFDNSVELDIQRHAVVADIIIPFGHYFSSRLFTSISPYTQIGVKQSTIFKPLVNETGTSSSTTVQGLSYTFRYDALIRTGTFFDIALVAYYDNQPVKYEIAQISNNGSEYLFESTTIDTNEVTTKFIAKVLFDIEFLGGVNPSVGYGVEKLDRKNNITGDSIVIDKNIFTIGFEKPF